MQVNRWKDIAAIRISINNSQGGEDATYRFVMENPNPHCSETLVKMIATMIGFEGDLGIKGRKGMLQSTASRREILSDPSHRIRFIAIAHGSIKLKSGLERYVENS
ncbi:hypothetical protein [Rhodopirellula europaea]|uniref:hypothetical protein n=1 Tax=Rhodopirellula europaea TaxID=1263866 RepID=UPI003D2D684C